MSATLLRQDVFDTEEVSYEQAIAYLRKEAIALSETAPRGYILLTYRNIPLGFVKNIGNRANNLYPQAYPQRVFAGGDTYAVKIISGRNGERIEYLAR